MKKRVHIFVSGKVQGVFFRSSMRSEANKLGITGWVRNLPDGRVEAVIEGENEKVDKMLKWCNKGPEYASVTGIESAEEDFEGEFEIFSIIR